jgi:molybdenum cofactor guanylyltransferase
MGREKALLPLGGRSFLRRVRDAMVPLVGRLRVVGSATSLADLAELECDVQQDLYPGLGPLSGIHAALATATCEVVLVVACDLPFVTTPFLQGLIDRIEPRFQAVVPVEGKGPVPVCALYRVAVVGPLVARLKRRELSARDFVASIETRAVAGQELFGLDPDGLCLRNVNTPADYDEALELGRL